jgi:transposase
MTFIVTPSHASADENQTDFLMLPGWRTLAVTASASSYEVEAMPLAQPSACTHCGGPAAALRPRGAIRQSVGDAPVRGKHVRVNFTRQRYHCGNCKRFSRQPLPGVSERRKMTDRLEELIAVEAFTKSFAMVSQETGSSSSQVRTIFVERVSEIAATVAPETPRVIGLDEIYLRRRARCVLTDLELRRPLEFLPRTDSLSLCKFLLHLPERHGVEAVVMDFWRSGFEVVRRVLPNAAVVINKWVVLQLAHRAALKVLKSVRERSADGVLPRPRYSLFVRACCSRLTGMDREALAKLFEREPELLEAYRLKREFFGIWNFGDRREAESRYEQWAASIPPALHYGFDDLLGLVNRWHAEVFNYFDHPFANGYTQSVLRKLRSLSSSCSFATARAKVLYGAYVKRPVDLAEKTPVMRFTRKKAKPKARRAPSPLKTVNNSERLECKPEPGDE